MTRSTSSHQTKPGIFTLGPAIVALLVVAPVIATFAGAIAPSSSAAHIWSTTGLSDLFTTLSLCALVGLIAGTIGTVSAFIVSLNNFPGRRLIDVGLVLPFAIPAYVSAYAYGDVFSPFGLVAEIIGVRNLPEIRSFGGVVFVMSLSVYPYVYLAMRASLASRSAALVEAARALGTGPIETVRNVLWPVSRPAFFGAIALALMETASEFGVADYFGVRTLSVGIFRTWYGLGDLAGATQLALMLFGVTVLLVLIEESARRGQSAEAARVTRASVIGRLSGGHIVLALFICFLPILFGFFIPAGIFLSKLEIASALPRGFTAAAINTITVALLGAIIIGAIGLFLAFAARRGGGTGTGAGLLIRLSVLGYAIPGAVIAIGLLSIIAFLRGATGIAVGGVGVLAFAYAARFLTAGYNAAAGGLAQVSTRLEDAASSLGAGPGRILGTVHLPLTRRAIAAGLAIVAIDIAKELPATLILRPFNFETLSTHIYRLASDERLAEAAPSALLLIGVSLIPVMILSGQLNEKTQT